MAFLSSSCFVLSQRSHPRDERVQGHPTAAIPTRRLEAAVNEPQRLLRSFWSLPRFNEIRDDEGALRKELYKADMS